MPDRPPQPDPLEPAAAPHDAAAPAPRPRVVAWDNARFWCVALVVVGHGIQRFTAEWDVALALYLVIYAFHMPAFAIISGYFSKAEPPSTRQMRRVVSDILLPYLIMESLWTLVRWLVQGASEFNPSQPSWTLWFLLALGIFRLVLPYLALLRAPLVVSIVLSVGVGYLDNVDTTLSLSRAFGILPFFVLGWRLRDVNLVDWWQARSARTVVAIRAAALAVFGLAAAVMIAGLDVWRAIDLPVWFFYVESYPGLGEDQWYAGLVRLLLIVAAVVLSTAFFALVPRRASFVTPFGRATMYIYLLHSFALYPLRESGVLEGDAVRAWWIPVAVVACVALAMLLATRPVQRLFRPLIEPKPAWLFRAEERDELVAERERIRAAQRAEP